MEKNPVVSIGIIFRDNIRSLERCLKSLQPLRDAVPSQLVMADTGAVDGSRAVAEKYADVLFDFPWINDFSAARNAVMDRCTGEWYLGFDSDEWLDEDIQELVAFFKSRKRRDAVDVCALMSRNYSSYEADANYTVFITWRMVRMSTGIRYEGALHEHWPMQGLRGAMLSKSLVHHDGYVEMTRGSAEGKEKMRRNISYLREELKNNPEDLVLHLQYVESGQYEPDFEEVLFEGLELVERKLPHWNQVGPPMFRHAANYARSKKLPQFEELIQKAEEIFPNSYFIRLDTAFAAASYYIEKGNYERCLHWGAMGVKAHEDYRAGRGDILGAMYSSLQTSGRRHEQIMRIMLSRSYFETGCPKEAVAVLEGLDGSELDGKWTDNIMKNLQLYHSRGVEGMSSLAGRIWEEIQKPVPSEKWAEARKKMFLRTGAVRFTRDYIENYEAKKPEFVRPVYTLYTPLKGRHILGTAAAILESDSPAEMEELLGLVEKWEEFPIFALCRAMQRGVQFPLEGRTMSLEEMDKLAVLLAKDSDGLLDILKKATEEDFAGSWQTLAWVRGLTLVAVQTFKWKNEETGLWLARTFAKVEQAFVAGCYTPEVLREGNLFVLPPMHRFGWYCVQAFDALRAGDTVGYARFLREGLAANKDMKPMVKFLTEHTPELRQVPPPSEELLALAEKVRGMLAAYPADDPAVEMLKASPVYQRVAHLIE